MMAGLSITDGGSWILEIETQGMIGVGLYKSLEHSKATYHDLFTV
jgi:hypothetical protein